MLIQLSNNINFRHDNPFNIVHMREMLVLKVIDYPTTYVIRNIYKN